MAAWSASITGDFRKNVAKIELAHKRAARFAVRTGGTALKNGIRREVKRAGLGDGIANAIRDKAFPPSLLAMDPAVIIFSKAIYKRPGGLVDIITVFREGAIINALGQFLLIGGRKIGKVAGQKAKLARAKIVKILPRLKGIDDNFARVQANLQGNYDRAYERELGKVA